MTQTYKSNTNDVHCHITELDKPNINDKKCHPIHPSI